MDNPRSLKWSLDHGYFISAINGTDYTYCEVVVMASFYIAGYKNRHTFLIRTKWMRTHFSSEFEHLSLPF